jgi:peptidyl-prolyl cis-trans isomerase SurA
MEVLRFIEERFRMGIRISQAEIDEYYKTSMLPAYQKENAPAPPEATIADRIQEILLQQQVDKLLDDWLATLRAQGSVRILKPGEEAP